MLILWTKLPGADEMKLGAHSKLHKQGHVKTIGADDAHPHSVSAEQLWHWQDSWQEATLLAGSQPVAPFCDCE